MKGQRRRDLIKILHEGTASSQQDIVDGLRSAGHDVTQATVSRDLQDVGARKVRAGGGFVYRLPDEIPRGDADLTDRNLVRTLDEFAIAIRPAASLVIVVTAPGHASAVARAIDLAGLDEVAGTIAGDDTIFVATNSERHAASLADAWLTQQAVRA
ncbi:MAG: arginine repressor [Actinobacteria bacterium]|nr:arginine repressor [Actinomycetota bacterium]